MNVEVEKLKKISMLKKLPYSTQWIDEDDISSVVDCLKSDFLTQGPIIKKFETMICEYTGARYCVVVANGTAALHLSVAALGITTGSQGITATNTFVATPNSMIYNGLQPRLVDIDFHTYNIDILQFKKKINADTKLVMPVHFAGQACNMEEISLTSKEHGIYIIEDASHAIGGKYADGSMIGNCKFSDLTTFSFHPVKNITCGEGGAITTNSRQLYNKLLLLRTHGITKDPSLFCSEKQGPWYYEMQCLGFNYRLTDIQAALGSSQLKRLNAFVERRQQIADKYDRAFSPVPWLTIPQRDCPGYSASHLYVILIDWNKLQMTRSNVMNELDKKNITTQVHYIPVHMHPFYREQFGYKCSDFPVAENYYHKALTIPLYPKMTDEDVEYVISGILSLEGLQ